MRIEKHHDSRIVAVWLTQEERESSTCAKELYKRFGTWRNEGYFPVVYCSGTGDLYEHTKGLLKYNRIPNA